MSRFPAKPADEIVIVPAVVSTAETIPPTPRFCQSSRSCSFLADTSDCFMTMTANAASDLPSAEACPRTSTRSPA